jgi:hypothetical protein
MNNPAAGHPGDGTGLYRVRVKGRLGSHWASWFDGVTLTAEPDGTTLLEGAVDQAALHGLLRAVRDTGLPLISVTRVDDLPADMRLTT